MFVKLVTEIVHIVVLHTFIGLATAFSSQYFVWNVLLDCVLLFRRLWHAGSQFLQVVWQVVDSLHVTWDSFVLEVTIKDTTDEGVHSFPV